MRADEAAAAEGSSAAGRGHGGPECAGGDAAILTEASIERLLSENFFDLGLALSWGLGQLKRCHDNISSGVQVMLLIIMLRHVIEFMDLMQFLDLCSLVLLLLLRAPSKSLHP